MKHVDNTLIIGIFKKKIGNTRITQILHKIPSCNWDLNISFLTEQLFSKSTHLMYFKTL